MPTYIITRQPGEKAKFNVVEKDGGKAKVVVRSVTHDEAERAVREKWMDAVSIIDRHG